MSTEQLNAGIQYLISCPEILPQWRADVIRACRAYPARIPIEGLWNRNHASRAIRVDMGGAGKAARVFQFLCQDAYYSAPTFDHGRVYTGKIETLWPLDDLIVRLVDDKALTIVNVTLPRHIFFPGLVKLSVCGNLSSTWVEVSGRGRGNWASLNERFGPELFQKIVSKVPAAMARNSPRCLDR